MVLALEKLKQYLEGAHFTVHSLVWLNRLTDPKGRLSRRAVKLQQFDFDIIHRITIAVVLVQLSIIRFLLVQIDGP